MKRIPPFQTLLLCLTASVALAGASRPVHADEPPRKHALFQYSVIDAFLSGVFDGDCTVGELKKHGDFGIGSFNGGDGEMVALNGVVYQFRAVDGIARAVADSVRTPFAVVNSFTPTLILAPPGSMTRAEFEKWLDTKLPTVNGIYGIKITGVFAYAKTRVIPTTAQRPYPPLAALIPTQRTFEFHQIAGTLVGYRLPAYMKAINIPGYHYHFLADDKTGGGHILDYTMGPKTRVEIDEIRSVEMRLPGANDAAFARAPLDKDRANETKTVEEAPTIR